VLGHCTLSLAIADQSRLLVCAPAQNEGNVNTLDITSMPANYVSQVFRLRHNSADLTIGTQEALIQSRALIAKVDDILAMNAKRLGWLWPAY
jgi:hypothetical protein